MFGMKKWLAGSRTMIADSAAPAVSPAAGERTALLCRDAVFDRQNRLAGHLFRLPTDTTSRSPLQSDQHLLDILATSQAAWNTQTAFIPLSAEALEYPALDRLPPQNLVLLIGLAATDPAPEILHDRVRFLRQRGLAIGLSHQPWHPAFDRLRPLADYGVIDVAASRAEDIRDFPGCFGTSGHPPALFAANIDSLDEHRLCRQGHFSFFHGRFAELAQPVPPPTQTDPQRAQLLNLLRLVEGDAETPQIAEAMKLAPVLTFRILRYLNSPAIGLSHRIDSISQALIMLGRQRLSRWLAILLFSVSGAGFADWLLVESALTRGRLMEELGARLSPPPASDPLFLTGIFSCLDRLLQRPLAEILDELPLSDEICAALLTHSGPLAPLLAIAEACETFDAAVVHGAAQRVGLSVAQVNDALLAATAWASEVTEHWE
ncbi:MAG: putative signal transduction protein containing and modified domain [Proteobacteria bacterium]|nr:putative signal transduction protein containing and modified domain [Pseudomonadota bacterium]